MERIQFMGFAPDESLRKKAEQTLDRIMEWVPPDLNVIIFTEKSGGRFHCRLEVESESCPVAVETFHRLAAIAIDKAELCALRKLARWRGNQQVPEEKLPVRAPFRLAN
jgi:hypothetical protein